MLGAMTPLRLVPLLPVGWTVLVTLGLLGLLAWGCVMLRQRHVPRLWVGVLAGLRVAIVLVFALCLLGPVMDVQRARRVRPQMLVLLDASRSMAQEQRFGDVVRPLRDGKLGEHLREHYEMHWYRFGATATPILPRDLDTMQPTEGQTRLAEALDAALRHHAALQPAAEAEAARPRVLLLSDGLDLSRRDAAEAARRYHAAVDVLPPPIRSTGNAGQVTLLDVQAPSRVMLGAEARFAVTLQRPAGGAAQTSVQLLEEGREVRRLPVSFEPGQTEARVLLSHRPVTVGLRQFSVQVADQPPYAVAVRVSDASHEVLVLEDRWRWSFRYLRRVLEDDPSYHMTALLSRGNQAYRHFGEPTRRVNLGGYPQGAGEIDWFDLIVLGDVDLGRWPPQLAQAIADAVTDRGIGLVVIAGPRLGELTSHPVLGPLLPVIASSDAGRPIDGPLRLQVSAELPASALLSVSPDSMRVLRSQQLPPVEYLYPVQRKRPAATVLLEASEHANTFGPLIAMAEQPMGRGRVLFVATDTLWKWQTDGPIDDQGQTLHQRFWQQALRALTPVQATTGQAVLWVRPAQSRVQAGDPVTVTLQLDPPTREAEVHATLVDPAGQSHALALDLAADEPGRYGGSFRIASSGPHRIDAAATLRNQPLASGLAVVQGCPAPRETDDQPADVQVLMDLAHATDGRVIDPYKPDTWPAPGAPAVTTVTTRVTADLWQNFTLLLILAALLAADWMLRMARGYA